MPDKPMPSEKRKTFDYLNDLTTEANADQGHVIIQNFRQEGTTAVYSIYHDVKPSTKVLEELIDWLEETEQKDILTKIDTLQHDMSWNTES